MTPPSPIKPPPPPLAIVFMGCVQFSAAALTRLLTIPEARVVGVVTRRVSPVNADFVPLAPLAAAAGVPCLLADGLGQEAIARWVRERGADILYCFGWSFLLQPALLTATPRGVVGFHPAALPMNRGRHPLIWALALGLEETATTFFYMDQGADSGDILDQRPLPITPQDDAATLYARMTEQALGQIAAFTPALARGAAPRTPQNPAMANTWRKREPADGRIDWRMSAAAIHNLVRALTRPYPGAHCERADGRAQQVWRVAVAQGAPPNLEPGRVLAVAGTAITVKCGLGGEAVRLLEHELHPLPKAGETL